MIRLNCSHVDTCLSDFWSGHHLAHICVPVWHGMSPRELREALHAELQAGAIAGSDDRARDDAGAIGNAWDAAAHAAINRDVIPATKGARRLFLDLEKTTEDDEPAEVYAYFVFSDADDSRAFWLRGENEPLEKARAFNSLRAAVADYEATARELRRYGQAYAATVHYSTDAESLDEYPDLLLSIGPRGGLKVEQA